MVKHKLQKHNYELSTYRNTKRNYKFCSEFVGNKAKRRILKRVGASRKQSTPNFAKNEHFLSPDTHAYVCVSGGKKCSFFAKFVVLCFLKTPVLRFSLLPYYRQINLFLCQYCHHVWNFILISLYYAGYWKQILYSFPKETLLL